MNKQELKKFRKMLLERKRQIITELLKDNEKYEGVFDKEGGDLADIAYRIIEEKLVYDLSRAQKEELEKIESALERIKKGNYGICIDCKEKIEKERLEAVPYALRCVACQTKYEKRRERLR